MSQTGVFGRLVLAALLISGCGGDEGKGEWARKPHLVEIASASKDTMGVERVRTGSLRALKEVKIYTQEEGRITELPYRAGDFVEQGAVIARLDDRILRAQFDRNHALRRKAEQNLQRVRRLYEEKIISQQDMIQAETDLDVAKADEDLLATRLGYATIKAPISGVIGERLTEPGNIAAQHTHILTILDMTSLITEVTLSDLLMPKMTIDDVVQVRIDALGVQTFAGHISRIYPNIDPVTRRGILEVELKPVPEGARPGQLCRVHLKAEAAERLLIPFAALRSDKAGVYVYTVDNEGRAARNPVTTGLRIEDRVEVIDGLTEGQRVVTKGFLDLAAGKQVEIVASVAAEIAEPAPELPAE
jgi:membrane fusion protein (multidrug efflux system)